MKIKLPKFPKAEEAVRKGYNFYNVSQEIDFWCEASIQGNDSEKPKIIIGYIYSGDFELNIDVGISADFTDYDSVKTAYEEVCRQLTEKYIAWVKENILEEDEEDDTGRD